MGFVYAGQGNDKTCYKVGRTEDITQRKKAHRTANHRFDITHLHETGRSVAAEAFLKALLADKRVSGTTETFEVTHTEMDVAFIELDRHMTTWLSAEQEEQLELFAKQKSNGKLLQADDTTQAMCDELRKTRHEMKRLELLEEHLSSCLKHHIGPNDGIQDLCSWTTQSLGMRLNADLVKTTFPEAWNACRQELVTRKFKLLDQPGD